MQDKPYIVMINSDESVIHMSEVKTIMEKNEKPAHPVKLFGMPAEKGRWVFVILGLVINLCLGSIYSWSVFRLPLQ